MMARLDARSKCGVSFLLLHLAVAAVIYIIYLCSLSAAQGVDGQDNTVITPVPFLMFASSQSIYRIFLNGSDLQELVRERNSGIVALDFHYRMGYMFWTNTQDRSIKRATLNGTAVTKIADRRGYPAGLAVDWINDRLYWTDRDYETIEEYDLTTKERRIILFTGEPSLPLGLAIYPYPNSGWLFWADAQKKSVQTAAIEEGTIGLLHTSSSERSCPWPATVDILTHRVYWADYCRFTTESVGLDGSAFRMVTNPSLHMINFAYGITVFGETIYWTQREKVYSANKVQGQPISELYNMESAPGGNILRGIQVIHPSRQPPAEELDGFALCDPFCQHGACLPPGVCTCLPGWTGVSCSEDVNECQTSNGGCDHQCHNNVGSYECSCNEGYILDSDGQTCIEQRLPTSTKTSFPTSTLESTNVFLLPSTGAAVTSIPPSSSPQLTEPSSSSTTTSTVLTHATTTSHHSTRIVTPSQTVRVTPTVTSFTETSRSISLSTPNGVTASQEDPNLHISLSTPNGVTASQEDPNLHRSLSTTVHPHITPEASHINKDIYNTRTPDISSLSLPITTGVELPHTPLIPPIIPISEAEEGDGLNVPVLIAVAVAGGILLLVVAIVSVYGAILYWKYAGRRGSWSPGSSERGSFSSGASLRAARGYPAESPSIGTSLNSSGEATSSNVNASARSGECNESARNGESASGGESASTGVSARNGESASGGEFASGGGKLASGGASLNFGAAFYVEPQPHSRDSMSEETQSFTLIFAES